MKRDLDAFWKENCDRVHMKSTIYPTLEAYLENKDSKRLLDIGADWFNEKNGSLFKKNDIEYWMIDINDAPENLMCTHFKKVSIFEICEKYPELIGYFDVVISYGVLGGYKFKREEIRPYLDNVYRLMKPDAYFMFKLDTSEIATWDDCFQISIADIHKRFRPAALWNLPESQEVAGDDGVIYTFYTLKKV